MSRPRLATTAAIVASTALLLVGCTSPAPAPAPVPTDAPASATPTIDPVAPPPEPVFDGTALENQAFFDYVNVQLMESGASLGGAAFIDSLVGAGYARELMEVTPDTTSIGIAADNVVFSIRFGDECLLGQWGNIGYTSMVAPVLSTGRCIVGTERPA